MANRGAWNQVETDEDGNQVGGVVKNGKKVPKEEGNIPVRGATVVVPVKKIEENLMSRRNLQSVPRRQWTAQNILSIVQRFLRLRLEIK